MINKAYGKYVPSANYKGKHKENTFHQLNFIITIMEKSHYSNLVTHKIIQLFT